MSVSTFAGEVKSYALNPIAVNPYAISKGSDWIVFENAFKRKQKEDSQRSLSYMISGSLALIGGIVGAANTEDPIEQTTYGIVQTIGVGSFGYGAHLSLGGSAEYALYHSLKNSQLSDRERSSVVSSYKTYNRSVEEKERLVRLITHGLVAGLNFYNGSKQENASTKSALFFVGGVNLLAAISFAF